MSVYDTVRKNYDPEEELHSLKILNLWHKQFKKFEEK